MSIVRLRKRFRKKMHIRLGKKKLPIGSPMDIVFWSIVVVFVVGAFYSFGPGGGAGPQEGERGARKVTNTVAVVNGQAISRAEFEMHYRMRASNIPQTEFVTRDRFLKTSLLDGMIQRLLLLDAAKREGVGVSRADINNRVDELVEEQVEQRFPDRRSLARYLKRRNISLEQYKAELRTKLAEDREAIREMVVFERLEEMAKGRATVSDKDLEDHYTRVRARHILIMPDQLRREDEQAREDETDEAAPESEKDYQALARERADGLLARLKEGEDFADLAKEHSHDFGSAEKGGLLHSTRPPVPGEEDELDEYFGPGEMVPEFDKAAFALKPDEISDLIETQYGFHIIQVLDRKVAYPEDFEEKQQDYRNDLLEERKHAAWREYQDNLKEIAQIEVPDPELAAYRALDDNRKAEAVQLLAKAVEDDPYNPGAKYQLAVLLRDAGETTKATELLRELTASEYAASSPQVHMEIGELYLQQDMNEQAVESFKAASEWAQAFDYQNMFLHQQAMTKFEELGEEELAAQEQKWLDEFNEHMRQSPDAGFGMPLTLTPPPMD